MGLLLALALILGIGLSIRLLPGPTPAVRPGTDAGTGKARPGPASNPAAQDPDSGLTHERREQKLARVFERAVRLLHDGHNKEALSAWHEVLTLAPKLPEAHVNMGFTLLSLGRAAGARDFFNSAIKLRAGQTNAYYGLALALDQLHEPEGAIRAMRDYLQRIKRDGRYAAKARLLIRIWEQRLTSGTATASGAQKRPKSSQ